MTSPDLMESVMNTVLYVDTSDEAVVFDAMNRPFNIDYPYTPVPLKILQRRIHNRPRVDTNVLQETEDFLSALNGVKMDKHTFYLSKIGIVNSIIRAYGDEILSIADAYSRYERRHLIYSVPQNQPPRA